MASQANNSAAGIYLGLQRFAGEISRTRHDGGFRGVSCGEKMDEEEDEDEGGNGDLAVGWTLARCGCRHGWNVIVVDIIIIIDDIT